MTTMRATTSLRSTLRRGEIACRKCLEATWLNDRDQFLYPNDGWQDDREFQGNCLVYTLFAQANNIQGSYGINHWIPFTEEDVGAQDCFASHFMSDFLKGKKNGEAASSPLQMELAASITSGQETASPLTRRDAAFTLSDEAKAVLEAGCELWRYYHKQPKAIRTLRTTTSESFSKG